MTSDKKSLYLISSITFTVLLATLLLPINNGKIVTACLLAILSALTLMLVKKRTSLSINKREVLLISTIVAIIFVTAIQLLGLYFGSYKNPYFFNIKAILTSAIPLLVIIVASELIRYVLLSSRNRFGSVMAFLTCLTAEVLAFSTVTKITSVNRFMDLVGLTLFPAITANVYYHYVSKSYGAIPNIAFRLITTLYIYFVPIMTDISDSIMATIKLILPIVMLILTSALFEKEKKKALKKGSKLGWIGTTLTVIFIVSISILISCQFRFGALVVATESMTGEINKGDMIIYEQYDDQTIKEGQVIVFEQHENKIIHRVVKIENIGGETRYYTKGDANETIDAGYRTESDIVGLTDVKLAYLGYPTLLLHELIKGSGN